VEIEPVKPVESPKNIFVIDTKMFDFDKYMSAYIVSGKEIALIDTGLPTQIDAVRAGIESHGISHLKRNCRIPDKNYLNMKARISSQVMTRRCCHTCGTPVATTDTNIREYAARSHPVPVDFLSSVNSLCSTSRPSLIEYYCPSCRTLLSVDIVLKDELEMVRPEFLLGIGKS
jgi:hypothetical protein